MKPLEVLLKERARKVNLTHTVRMVCNDNSHNDIMNALGNVMIQTLANLYPTGRNATHAWDEIARRIRDSLEQEYDGATGKRKVHLTKVDSIASAMMQRNA